MAARRRSKRDLHVVVTESDGTVTSLLVARGGFNQIRKNPISGLGQVVTTGDSAERSDQRTPQVIYTDQTGGMGEFFYTETAGITTFTDSECDTRFPGMVCLPPAVTLLGAAAALGATTGVWHVEYVNETNATRIAWASGAQSWRYTGSAWTTTGMPANANGFAIFNGRYYLADTAGVYYSTNATAWTLVTIPPPSSPVLGIAVHDNKLWIIAATSTLDRTLLQSTDGTTFTAAHVLVRNPAEEVTRLVAWRDRVGREVLYIFTNQRLLDYDEDSDQHLGFYQFTRRTVGTTATGWAEPWQRDGNLYAVLNTAARPETIYSFSGTTNRYAPNTRGGLPNASRMNLVHHRGGDNWLYFWGTTRGNGAATTAGRVLAMNDQGAFHTLMLGNSTADYIVGGGYDEGLLWAVTSAGSVYELGVPDNTDLPLYVTAGERTYPGTGTGYHHEYAFTDGGTPLMNKQWLWVTVTCLDHTSANKVPGLPASTSVLVEYRRDTDTAWTSLGTLLSASTFPAVLPIGSGFGVKAKQIKIRLTLASSSANNTPIVASVALAYTRQEVPRYAYSVPIDLGDRTHPLYKGKSIAQLLAAMDRWTQPGALVKFQMAGGDYATAPSTSTTVANATFAYSGQEDAERGPGTYTGLFSDYSPPASG